MHCIYCYVQGKKQSRYAWMSEGYFFYELDLIQILYAKIAYFIWVDYTKYQWFMTNKLDLNLVTSITIKYTCILKSSFFGVNDGIESTCTLKPWIWKCDVVIFVRQQQQVLIGLLYTYVYLFEVYLYRLHYSIPLCVRCT